MPSKVYLGPNLNFWCNTCNIPILEMRKCPICGSVLKKLEITPPYEVVPAFEKDLDLIRGVLDSQYGKKIGTQLLPSDKVVLLNKAPYYDRMDEVIVDGFVLGNVRFNLQGLNWEFIPKMEGARRLSQLKADKWIEADDGAIDFIAKGANLLAPGVINYDKNLRAGDYAIVVTSGKQAIATGPAKYSATHLESIKKGMVVKTKDHAFPSDPVIRPGGQDWNLTLEANKKIINIWEKKAQAFIVKTVEKFKDYPITVSFSGGKDSLCLLLLIKEVLGETDIFFIDTGIEFPETVEYTKNLIVKLGLAKRFTCKESRESFWENLTKFGPPAKDYRWCCKVIKLASVTEVLQENYPGQKVLTFIGSRQYESSSRRQDSKIWSNFFLPQQIGISPIHKWPSLLIWMYILSKKVEINPLYFKGYKRIGCIYCPATKLSELGLLKELHPDLYTRWMDFLRNWAEKYGLASDWAERGFWRWRKFKERGQINLAQEMGIPKDKIFWQRDDKLQFYLAEGVNPCQDGSYSIEGRIDGYLHTKNIINQLSILGAVKYSQSLGVISMRAEKFSLNLFSDGTIIVRGEKKSLEHNREIIIKIIKRANECIGCGICVPSCPRKALSLQDEKIWVDVKLCQNCGTCFELCPVIKYIN